MPKKPVKSMDRFKRGPKPPPKAVRKPAPDKKPTTYRNSRKHGSARKRTR